MHAFDAMSLKCNPHHRQHCIHHCLSGPPAACVCVYCVCHGCWGQVLDWLIRVCLRCWCQTLLRQCFHNECICVCQACKTALRSITAMCFGVLALCVCVCLCFLCSCGLVCTVLLFSHAWSYPSSVYSCVIECRQPSQRVALWLGSGCVSRSLSLLLSYRHCWPCHHTAAP